MSCVECIIGEGPTIGLGLLLFFLILLEAIELLRYIYGRLFGIECTFVGTDEDDPPGSSDASQRPGTPPEASEGHQDAPALPLEGAP